MSSPAPSIVPKQTANAAAAHKARTRRATEFPAQPLWQFHNLLSSAPAQSAAPKSVSALLLPPPARKLPAPPPSPEPSPPAVFHSGACARAAASPPPHS